MRNSYQSQSLVHEACMHNQSLFCKKENVSSSEKKLDQFSFLGNRARYVNRPRFVDTELETSQFSGGTK